MCILAKPHVLLVGNSVNLRLTPEKCPLWCIEMFFLSEPMDTRKQGGTGDRNNTILLRYTNVCIELTADPLSVSDCCQGSYHTDRSGRVHESVAGTTRWIQMPVERIILKTYDNISNSQEDTWTCSLLKYMCDMDETLSHTWGNCSVSCQTHSRNWVKIGDTSFGSPSNWSHLSVHHSINFKKLKIQKVPSYMVITYIPQIKA